MKSVSMMGGEDARRLYSVAQALTAALSPEDVAGAVYQHALADLGASTAGFWLLDRGLLRFASGAGAEEGAYQVGDIPLDSELPGAVAARTGKVVAFGSVAERNARWPSLSDVAHMAEAVAVLPMAVQGQVLGCLHVGYAQPMGVEEMELDMLGRLAELSSAALHRAQLYDQERLQRELLEFFSDATRTLTRSLDPSEVVQALVDIAVPRLADRCAVLVPTGDSLVPVALRILGEDPAEHERLSHETYLVNGPSLAARSFRSGQPEVVDPVPEGSASRLRADTPQVVERVGVSSALLAPVHWAGQPIGLLSLAWTRPGMARNPRVREMAEGLALRAGVALNNAARFTAERSVARALTDALLPGTTPLIPGYSVAVEYLPAAGDVAGDWYDILRVGDRYLVGVGDAAGHGISAASLMSELRSAARGLAASNHGPGQILAALRTLAAGSDDDLFGTALYGLLDPATHQLIWASAGHLPPVLVTSEGARAVELAGNDPPIGAAAAGVPVERRLSLGIGESLVLYTDGVVERRGVSIEDGVSRLSDLLRNAWGREPATVVEMIATQMCHDATDDSCIVIVHRDPVPARNQTIVGA